MVNLCRGQSEPVAHPYFPDLPPERIIVRDRRRFGEQVKEAAGLANNVGGRLAKGPKKEGCDIVVRRFRLTSG